MRNLGLGVGLFSVATMVSTSLWYANAPGSPLGQPTYATASAKEADINEADFIKQIKASLNKGNPRPPVDSRGLLVRAAHGSSYGINQEFIKKACSDFVQRSP